MGILLTPTTTVLVQGATGKEGQKNVRAMRDYHTNVVAGVTPGKGGQSVEGLPIYNSVREANENHGAFDASVIVVPPFAAKAAILEAIEAGIPLINILVERIPLQDTAYCLAAAREKGVRLLGPSSLGCIVPNVGRLGVVGGPLVEEIFTPGTVGIISRSGGMTNELSWQIRQAGLGQSAAVHVGGDLLMGTTYAELLELFEADPATKAVIVFGEHGGSYEFEIVELIKQKKYSKPLAMFIGGKFANLFPEGVTIGHAGAIVGRGQSAAEKEAALQSVGVMIADRYETLVELVKPYA